LIQKLILLDARKLLPCTFKILLLKKKFWHKILSYFSDVYIESTSSKHNPELHVILSSGRYQLCTSNAVYSYEDKYVNFKKAFEWIDWEQNDIKKVLVLGLGLASVPQMLEQVFKQKFEYHAVEIDEMIIDLANRYVLNDLDSSIQIFHADALLYTKLSSEKYDMIIMDVFDSDVVPAEFESQEFLKDLEALLAENGFVLFNRLNVTEKDHLDTQEYYNKVFSKVFKQSSCSAVEGNYMLLSRKEVFAHQNS